MQLVIGAGEFLGDHVSRALAAEVPVIELNADADDETLSDAISAVEVVINCAQTWSPARRLRFRKNPPPLLERIVAAARRAKVRRIVHVSTADVYGSGQPGQANERSPLKPVHVFERLKLQEEQWLIQAGQDLEVVIVRPARIFGAGEDWILPRLMSSLAKGRRLAARRRTRKADFRVRGRRRARVPGRGRPRPARPQLPGGRIRRELAGSAGVGRSMGRRRRHDRQPAVRPHVPEGAGGGDGDRAGAVVWPGTYAVDVLGRHHFYDDSQSRRDLTWSPSVGSFEQEMPRMTAWLASLPQVAAALAADQTAAISPRGK